MGFSEELKEKVSLKELVEKSMRLNPKGPNKYIGLSPFKKEKTPSFYLDDELGIWKDFASNKGGGIIDWVVENEGYSRSEAIQFLVKEYGLTSNSKVDSSRLKLNELLEEAQAYFLRFKDKAVDFVVNDRGYPEEIVEEFGLGYCPEGLKLYEHLNNLGYTEEDMTNAGLVSRTNKYKGEKLFVRHSGRVTFPIKDKYGRCISFTGRRIDGKKEYKYIHGANSAIFKKEHTLFGIDKSSKLIREQKKVVVCEGTFDAILLIHSGIPAVAVLGADVSDSQLEQLSTLSPNIYLLFDSDSRGREALSETFYKIENLGGDAISYAVVVPEGKDAADYFHDYGEEGLKSLIEEALPDTAVVVSMAVEEAKLKHVSKASVARSVLTKFKPYVNKEYTYRYLDLLDRLSEYLNLDRRNLESWISSVETFKHNQATYVKLDDITFPAPIHEKRILVSCISNPLRIKVLKKMGITSFDFESTLVAKSLKIIDVNKENPIDALREGLSEEDFSHVSSAIMVTPEEIDITTLGQVLLRKKKSLRGAEDYSSILGRPRRSSEKDTAALVRTMLQSLKADKKI